MKNNCGNAVLEMLLCTPLALFFLFAVTDTGLTLLQSAGLRDAVRAGIGAEARSGREAPAMTMESTGEFSEISQADLTDTARRVAAHIEANLVHSKALALADGAPQYQLEVTPVTVGIDPDSGQLLAAAIEVGATVSSPGSTPAAGLACPAERAPADFAAAELREDQNQVPSRYAVPSGFMLGGQAVRAVFMPKALFFQIVARVAPNNANGRFTARALGKSMVMCEQRLADARNFVH